MVMKNKIKFDLQGPSSDLKQDLSFLQNNIIANKKELMLVVEDGALSSVVNLPSHTHTLVIVKVCGCFSNV